MSNSKKSKSRLFNLRYAGHKGSYITQHRAFAHNRLKSSVLMTVFLLPLLATLSLYFLYPLIMDMWASIYDYWFDVIKMKGEVMWGPVDILSFFTVNMAVPVAEARLPTNADLNGTLVFVVLFSLFGVVLSKSYKSLAYMIWMCTFLLFATVIFYKLVPFDDFDIREHMLGHMALSASFVVLMPWVLGLTYNIFNLGLENKLLLTLLTLCYYVVLLPMQYLLHLYLIYHFSIVVIPLLYFAFLIIIDVMILIAFYSWALTWFSKKERDDVMLETMVEEFEASIANPPSKKIK